MKKLLIALFLFLPVAIHSEEEKRTPIDCSADYLEYDEINNKVFAKGNVKVKYKDIIIAADKVNFDTKTSDIDAEGHITVTEKDNIISGDVVKYNLKKQTGIVKNMEFFKKPWLFKGESIEKSDEKNAYMNSAYATTCNNKEHPHYRLVSNQIHVELDEKIESWHMFFYIGEIPVFYFPYFYRSLKPSVRSPFEVRPGYTTYEGFYLKASYNYQFSDYFNGSILLDYMTKRGLGYGLQQNYRFKDNEGEGTFYTYYLAEKDTGHARWRIDWNHRNLLEKDITLVGRLNFLSDQSITNDLYSFYYPVDIKELRSFLAVTKSAPDYTLVVSTDRYDSWDDTQGKYFANQIYLPVIRFQTSSLKIGETNAYFSLSSDLTNYYNRNLIDENAGHYIARLTFLPSIFYSIALMPGSTINTSVNFNGSYQNLPDYNMFNNGFNGAYSTNLGWSYTWNQYFATNVGHSYSRRLTNILNDFYGGVDLNKLTGSFTFRFRDRFVTNTSTGFDLRSDNPRLFERFDNIINDISIMWSDDTDTYINSQYNVITNRISFVNASANFGKGKQLNYGVGISYVDNFPSPGILDLKVNAAFNITDDIRLDLGASYDTSINKIKEQRVGLSANITDCWFGSVSFLKSWNNISFQFNFGLRAFNESGISQQISPQIFSY